MDLPDIAGEDDGSWTHVGDTGFQMANTEYEPSIRTDLPFATEQTGTSISENYDPMLSCSQLGSHCQVVSWSCHGRADFGIKRPAPFHAEPLIHDTLDDTVEQRVMAKQTVEVNFFCSISKMFRRRHGVKNVKQSGKQPYADGSFCWDSGRHLRFL